MPQEPKIRFTGRSDPVIRIKGIDKVIKLDLEKHKDLLERSKLELDSYRESVSHLIKRKKHYKSLLNGSKYSDEALRESMGMIAVDIRAMSDKVKLSQDAIDHHTLIVDTLSRQLDDYNKTGGICH